MDSCRMAAAVLSFYEKSKTIIGKGGTLYGT